MSLGLVSYDDSEESDSEGETETGSVTNTVPCSGDVSVDLAHSRAHSGESEQISDEEVERNEDSEKHLHLPQSKLNILNTDIDVKRLTSSNKRNGPVKITIPSLNEVPDDEPPSKKKLKPSQKGSGLFALLPNPKSSLVPQSVKKNHNVASRKSNQQTTTNTKSTMPSNKAPVITKPSLIAYDDSGDEEEPSGTVDFFSLDSKEVVAAPAVIDLDLPESSGPASVPHADKSGDWNSQPQSSSSLPPSVVAHEPVSEYPTTEFMSLSNENLELNQEAMQQLCGRRDRLRIQEVDLIDVSGDAIMPDARDWLTKQLTEETSHRSSHKKRDGPTTQQKRKHQITYLAFQAKENELELKNQWANNRMSRKQTQAKYGF